MSLATRTGPIHRFGGGGPGPTVAAFSAASAAFEPSDVPVDVRSAATGGAIGEATLLAVEEAGGELIATLAWDEELDALAAAGQARARCLFSADGTLARVVVEVAGDGEALGAAIFRSWSKADRDALPAADFGDPKSRLFPIADQDDVASAASLIGKAGDPEAVKAEILAICKRKGLTPPEAWAPGKSKAKPAAMSGAAGGGDAGAVRDVAAFDLGAPQAAGDMVTYPDSLLFRPGEYQSHSFSMTPEEMWAAAEAFKDPVPNELEHVNSTGTATILDGKLGHVEAVRLASGPDGHELRGTVVIPRWLDEAWDAPAKQVSCVWDRGTKTLQRLGLVVKGRVEGAALMAAFSAKYPEEARAAFAGDRTWQGQSTLQDVHDTTARAGAVCSKANSGRAMMHSAPELSKIQAIHDAACEGGARCAVLDEPREAMRRGMFARFSPRKKHDHATAAHQAVHDVVRLAYPGLCSPGAPPAAPAAMADHPEQFKALRKIHGLASEHGARCPGAAAMAATRPPAPRKTMGKYDKFFEAVGALPDEPTDADMLALFRLAPREAIESLASEAPPDPYAAFSADPVGKKLLADLEELKRKDADREAAEAMRQAVAFADPTAERLMIGLLPAVLLRAAMFQAAAADKAAASPLVTFADAAGKEEKVGLADALRRVFDAIPDSPLARQVVESGGSLPAEFSVMRVGKKEMSKEEDEAEDERLLAMTPSGQAALERRKAAKSQPAKTA